jgi:hypothetical protein
MGHGQKSKIMLDNQNVLGEPETKSSRIDTKLLIVSRYERLKFPRPMSLSPYSESVFSASEDLETSNPSQNPCFFVPISAAH